MNNLILKLKTLSNTYKSISAFDSSLLINSASFYMSENGKELRNTFQKQYSENWEAYYYVFELIDFHINQLKKFKEIQVEIALLSIRSNIDKLLVSEVMKINRLANENYLKIKRLIKNFNVKPEQIFLFNIEYFDLFKYISINTNFRKTDNFLDFGNQILEYFENLLIDKKEELTKYLHQLANERASFLKTYILFTHLHLSNYYRLYLTYNCTDYFDRASYTFNTVGDEIIIKHIGEKPILRLDIDDVTRITHEHLNPNMLDASIIRISKLLTDELCEVKIFWKGSVIELQAMRDLLFNYVIAPNQIKRANDYILKHFYMKDDINRDTLRKGTSSQTYKDINSCKDRDHPISKVLIELTSFLTPLSGKE